MQEDKEKEEDGADEPQQRPLSGKQAREQRWKLMQPIKHTNSHIVFL